MKSRASGALGVLAGILLLSSVARPDGKFFSPVAANINIPDQSAVICFDGKTEELIIDTAYEGEGTDFAWVVPLPAVPKVQKRTRGLVPTLRMLCRPRVVLSRWGPDYLIAYCVTATVFAWLGLAFLGRKGGMAAVAFLVLLLPIVAHKARAVHRGMLAKAAEMAPQGDGDVTIHSRERIGAYDVSTVSAATADALLKWLNENEYKVDPAVKPVVDAYIDDGWCFVIYKFAPSSKPEDQRAHPLSFTFASERAVYPMRLTAVGNGPLALDLYVLAGKEARAPHMARERTASVHTPKYDYSDPYFGQNPEHDPHVPVYHDEFAEISEGFPVLTKLTATLTPEQMADDLYLSWQKVRPYRKVMYSRRAGRQRMVSAGAITMVGLTVLVLIYAAVRNHNVKRIGSIQWRWLIVAVFAVFATQILRNLWPILIGGTSDIVVVLAAAGLIVTFVLGAIWASAHTFIGGLPIHSASELYSVGLIAAPTGAFLTLWHPLAGWTCLAAAFVAVLLGGMAMEPGRVTPGLKTQSRLLALVLVLSVLAAGVTGVTLRTRTTDIQPRHHGHVYQYDDAYARAYGKRIEQRSWDATLAAIAEVAAMPFSEFRDRVNMAIASHGGQGIAITNPYTGNPVREENSPGNYTLEQVDGHNALFHYDINGMKIESMSSLHGREHMKKRSAEKKGTNNG